MKIINNEGKELPFHAIAEIAVGFTKQSYPEKYLVLMQLN